MVFLLVEVGGEASKVTFVSVRGLRGFGVGPESLNTVYSVGALGYGGGATGLAYSRRQAQDSAGLGPVSDRPTCSRLPGHVRNLDDQSFHEPLAVGLIGGVLDTQHHRESPKWSPL